MCSDALRGKLARRFVSIVKEESGDYVGVYEAAFFTGSDLARLNEDERELVKRHVLARLSEDDELSWETIYRVIGGIGGYLSISEARTLVHAIVRELSFDGISPNSKPGMRRAMDLEYSSMDPTVQAGVIASLNLRRKDLERRGKTEAAEEIDKLKSVLEASLDDTPF